MSGLENNVDFREHVSTEPVLPHGTRKELDMEKLALIDFTLEDDDLLPSNTTPENKHPQTFESVLPLSPTVVNGTNCMCAKEQQCTNSGGMGRDGGKTPGTPAIKVHVEPSVERTYNNSEAGPADRQHVKQHGMHLNGPIHENMEGTGAQLNAVGLSNPAGKKTRSARASNNLRKSLAWDKAFSTDEGVLDVDELPLVTKTPRKLPKLHPLNIPEILGISSPAHFSASPAPLSYLEKAVPSAKTVHEERITSSFLQRSIHSDCHPSDMANSLTCEATSFKVNSPARTPSKPDTKSNKSDSTRLVPASQIIKADVLKGTRLRLPSSFTGKKDKIEISPKLVSTPQEEALRRCKSSSSLLSPYSASSALSKKVSSVSKKVKDTLGKVLPGGFGGSSKNRKASEDTFGSNHGSPLKALPSPLGHTLDVIGEDVNTPGPTSTKRSKSSRSFLSGISKEAETNTRKKCMQAEMSNREATTTQTLGNGTIVPSSKGTSRLKNVALLVSLYGKAGSSSKKISEKPSFYSSKVSPVFSKKKSAPAASAVLSLERFNPANAAQSDKAYASGLRLPSPKIGFFDTTRPSTGDQPSSFPERGASDNSNDRNPRHGLPSKPQHGLPAGRAEQSSTENSFPAAASRMPRSGIPTAPHLKPFRKREKGPVPSISASNSPQKHHRGQPTQASYQAGGGSHLSSKANSDRFHTSSSELTRNGARNEPAEASEKLILESRDGDSNQPLKTMEHRQVDAQPGIMDMPFQEFSMTHEHEAAIKSGSSGRDQCSSSKLANSSIDNTRTTAEQPATGSIQSTGLIEKSVRDGKLSSMVEGLSPESKVLFGIGVIDSVLCKEEAGSVIDALTTPSNESSRWKKLTPPPDTLDSSVCSELVRLGGDQLACYPEHDAGFGHEIADRSVSGAPKQKTLGPRKKQLEIVNFGLERRWDNDSSLQGDNEEDWRKSSGYETWMKDDFAVRNLVLENSATVVDFGNEELVTDNNPRNIPDVGRKSSSAANCGTEEEQVQEWRESSQARHPDNEVGSKKIDHVVDSPSHRSDWPILGAHNTFSHATLDAKHHTSPITPRVKRLSGARTVNAENTQYETLDSLVTRPADALDSQNGKSPLSPNVGLLNDIGNRTTTTTTTTTPARKDRNLQVAFDHSASEVSGQENSTVSQGRAGSFYLHKPKQRKPYSNQNLEQPEANGTAEHSFPFSEERLRALEAAGQESLQKKSGAVQHSPPHKISPNRNPWSPVKRNGQQLGPFDCTKKYTNASTGQ